MHERIDLKDTATDAITKLAEGNIGAAIALGELFTNTKRIDPANALQGYSPLFALDTLGIYGPRIWLLWKDVCSGDPVKVLTLFRAWQLGILNAVDIQNAARTRSREHTSIPFDFTTLLAEVRKQVPDFAQKQEA